MTYGELARRGDAFAAALAAPGVAKGDRVALLLPNCPQLLVCELGAWKAGAIVAPLNPIYTAQELEGALRRTGAETIVVLTPSTGYQVWPRGIEEVLATHPAVAEVEFRAELPKTMVGKVRRRALTAEPRPAP